MTKKKNIASKLVLVLFVLTLISCCLLGSTFARYVSGGTGSASVGIAKWDVTGLTDSMDISVDAISPSMADFEAGKDRTNSTTPTRTAFIENNSEVAATVTVTLDDITFKAANGDIISGGAGINETGNMPSYSEMKNVVMLQIYASKSDVTNFDGVEWKYVSGSEQNVVITAELAKTERLFVYYRVEWKSADVALGEATADYLDTWIGQNVETISATLSYTAVQGSEQP